MAPIPTIATGTPIALISKNPMGSRPAAAICPATTRLVEVPISVAMPPSSAANDNGINSLLTDTWRRSAQDEICGMSMATIGVLLRNADVTAVGGSTRSRGSRSSTLAEGALHDRGESPGLLHRRCHDVQRRDRERGGVAEAAERLLGVDDAQDEQRHRGAEDHQSGGEGGAYEQDEDADDDCEGQPGVDGHGGTLGDR